MTNSPTRLAPLAAAASAVALAAALALAPAAARAQACANPAAFGLYAGSYMDTALNPPPGEDTEFFSSTGGVPTVYFLIDNSGSMLRLAPNGPGFYGSPLPPLNDINCPAGGDLYDPGCANQNLVPLSGYARAPPGVMGCGLDPVSAPYAGGGTAIGDILRRSFAPTCGKSLTPSRYLAGYDASVDYAHEASICPYFKNPISSFETEPRLDGYDPDFYCGSTGSQTTCPSVGVNLFDKNLVFHEAISDGEDYPGGEGSWGFNGTEASWDPSVAPGNGWDEEGGNTGVRVFPYRNAVGSYGTSAQFCAQYAARLSTFTGVTAQGGTSVESLCNTCLGTRGFFLDGYAYRQAQEGLPNVRYASIWLTGNYLNFFPPKFLVARKALKDILMNNLHMRAGIAAFSGGGASLKTAAAQVQALNPACNNVYDSNANLWSNRSTFMTAINNLRFNKSTPLGEALFNVGQLFRTPDTPWFAAGDTYENAAFEIGSTSANQQAICFPCQSSNVVVISDGRPKWNDDPGSAFPAGSVTSANVGAPCTATSTDGCAGSVGTGIVPGPDATVCPLCQGPVAAGGAGGTSPWGPWTLDVTWMSKDYLNNAVRVAWTLHNMDFRRDGETAYACNNFQGKQALNVYTLGFGTNFAEDANTLLGNMAKVGGGIFVAADNPAELTAAFASILETIDTRATSFSVAAVNALQATASQSVVVPRFYPAKAAFWNGHLYRFDLYSEFAAGCVAGGTGDLDCDCGCTSVFLKDAQGSFISEDQTGSFRKNVPDKPTCGPSNHCATCGKPSKTEAAVPYWDAADRLAGRSWKHRVVYTAIDDPGALDGVIDHRDPVVPLIDPATHAFDATTITRLLPYMGLSLAAGGSCDKLGGRLGGAGDAVGAWAVSHDLSACAKAFLAYLLGADVVNEDLATSTSSCPYPPPSPGVDASGNSIWDPLALCDRGPPNAPGKLGDIFHSSPVRVLEPRASSDLVSSYSNQTLASLWLTSTPSDGTSRWAYDDYAAAYDTRRRVVVVGANDGLLHAFDAGNWQANADDPALLPAVRTSLPPFNGYYDKGTGDELWAFLPPDLVAKVPLMLGGQHHFFVDGDPLVRDVWVDGGTANDALGGTATADDKKQPNEFHTVVVAAERRGGSHYFALDVTDATRRYGEAGYTPPRFLWIFPQPTDPEQLNLGETYTGFLPNPPPIGPVRLDASTVGPAPVVGVTPTYVDSTGATVRYHERWVVFLSGGFDPQYVRGRGVHMLDVWTGKELFRFTRPSDAACVASTDPRCKLDAPVAGTVSMVPFGPAARADQRYPQNGGFFDTATFGDTNGALWTLRFNDPGKLGANGRVDGHGSTNWFGARSFQFAKASGAGLCSGRQPFFYSTANVPLYASNRMLRVVAGTGDRFNQLDQYGGTCGPDNIRACMLRGCTVSVPSANNLVTADTLLGTQSGGLSANACTTTAEPVVLGASGNQCTSVVGKVQVDISNCTDFDDTTRTGTTKSYAVECTPSGDGASCVPTATATQYGGDKLVKSVALDYNNWYLSVRVFDDSGDRAPFTTLAQAAAYDAARLTLGDLVQIDGSSATPAETTADAAGWAMFFMHDATYTDPESSKTYNIAKADERTASPSSTPGDNCVYWNTVQPTLLPKSAQCPCTYQNTDRLMYYYGANIAGGGLCLKETTSAGTGTACTTSSTDVRSKTGTTLTTPAAPQTTYFISDKGQVSVGLVSVNVGSGASNVSTGGVQDAIRPVGWVPISRSLEACRHASGAPSAASCQQ